MVELPLPSHAESLQQHGLFRSRKVLLSSSSNISTNFTVRRPPWSRPRGLQDFLDYSAAPCADVSLFGAKLTSSTA